MTNSATQPEEAREFLECRLELPALSAQRERYRTIGRHLERIERGPCRLDARFDADVNAELVLEAVEVERECCSLFSLDYDRSRRSLAITVQDPAHDPALEALHQALTDFASATPSRGEED